MIENSAWVFIKGFGSDEDVKEIIDYLNTETLWYAYSNDHGTIVLPMKVREIGDFFNQAKMDTRLNWIEYGVQF